MSCNHVKFMCDDYNGDDVIRRGNERQLPKIHYALNSVLSPKAAIIVGVNRGRSIPNQKQKCSTLNLVMTNDNVKNSTQG